MPKRIGYLFNIKIKIFTKSKQILGVYAQSMEAQNDHRKTLLAHDVTFTGPAGKAIVKYKYITSQRIFFIWFAELNWNGL